MISVFLAFRQTPAYTSRWWTWN